MGGSCSGKTPSHHHVTSPPAPSTVKVERLKWPEHQKNNRTALLVSTATGVTSKILMWTHKKKNILVFRCGAALCLKNGRALSANSVQALYHKGVKKQTKKRTPGTDRNYSLTFENYNHAWINLASSLCSRFYICWLNTHGDTKQFTD